MAEKVGKLAAQLALPRGGIAAQIGRVFVSDASANRSANTGSVSTAGPVLAANKVAVSTAAPLLAANKRLVSSPAPVLAANRPAVSTDAANKRRAYMRDLMARKRAAK